MLRKCQTGVAVSLNSTATQNRALATVSHDHHHLGYLLHASYHNHFTALFWDHLGEPVPEENFWTLWCKGRLTEADTQTIRVVATPSGLTSAHLHHPDPPSFLQGECPSCRPTNRVKALKATYYMLASIFQIRTAKLCSITHCKNIIKMLLRVTDCHSKVQ